MRLIKVLVVVLIGVTGLAAPVVTASAASASTKTVVYGFGGRCPPTHWAHPLVRPAKACFGLAGEDGIRHIRWRDWRLRSAFGHGSHLLFNGFGFTRQHATISLSRVRTHRGHRYFSHLAMRWTTKNGRHHKEVLNWRRVTGAGWMWD